MKTEDITRLIVILALIALCVFISFDYFSLRRSGNEMARKLGYGSNWRSVIANEDR